MPGTDPAGGSLFDRAHRNKDAGRNGRRRDRRTVRGPGRPAIALNEEGVPVAPPGTPPPSPTVFVSEESRARYPWLPPRVIAGSVWRGPEQSRVRVDENGQARPWRTRTSVDAA